MALSSLRNVSKFAVRVAVVIWFLAHFGLTLIYALPITPLKVVLQPLVYGTIGRFFAQNWSFFAPNPVTSNYSLLVHPLREAEWLGAKEGGLPIDGWYDLTRPVWEQFQRHRFSAYERLARPQSNGIRSYVGNSAELIPWMDACTNGDENACSFVQRRTRAARVTATKILSRIASSYCNERFASAEFVAVAIRIRQETPAPWSERYSSASVVHDRDVGIFPIDRAVAASGLYRPR